MAAQRKVLRIVVVSSSDVQDECDTLEEIIRELNHDAAGEDGLYLDVIRWETDAYPGFHPEGSQGIIDSLLDIENCDLLIGIFWKRLSIPEHEFQIAYESWKLKHHPQIMIYCNQQAYTPRSKAEVEEWGRVLEFQEKFPKEGVWWLYKGKSDFGKVLRRHLSRQILKMKMSLTKAEEELVDALSVSVPSINPSILGSLQSEEISLKNSDDMVYGPVHTGYGDINITDTHYIEEFVRKRIEEKSQLDLNALLKESIQRTRADLTTQRNERLQQARITFIVALIVLVLAIILVFVGVILIFTINAQVGIVSSVASIVTGIVSGLALTLNKQTNDRMDEYARELVVLEKSYTGMQYISLITDIKIRDEAIRDLSKSISLGKQAG